MFESLEEFDRWIEEGRQEEKAKRSTMAKPRGVIKEAASALGAGVVSTGESIAGAGEMIGIPGARGAREYLQEVGEAESLARPADLQEGTIVEHPERLADWRWWVRSLGENIPNMAAMMLPGGLAWKGAKALGWGLKAIKGAALSGAFSGAATVEAGAAYTQAKKEMDEFGYADDVIERVATAEGMIVGTVNGVLEMLPFDNLFLRSVGAPSIIRKIVRQAVFEGSTEMAQETVSLAVEQWGHQPDVELKDAIGRVLESGIIGGVLGGGAGAVFKEQEQEKKDKGESDQPISTTGQETTKVGESEIRAAEEARKEKARKIEKAKADAPAVLAEILKEEEESRIAAEAEVRGQKPEVSEGQIPEVVDEGAQEGRVARVLGEEESVDREAATPGGPVPGGEPGERAAAAGGGGEGGEGEIAGGQRTEVRGQQKTEVPETQAVNQVIDAAANEAATSPKNDLPEPTEGQKEKENYKMGHPDPKLLHGLDISIENPKGSIRKGKSKAGVEWQTEMKAHYGHINGTEGADSTAKLRQGIDVFIGESPESEKVFVINQVDPSSGKFDEHKTMLNYSNEKEAREGYLANYEKGWKGLGSIVAMDMEQFKAWIKEGDTTKAAEAQIEPTAEEKPISKGVASITGERPDSKAIEEPAAKGPEEEKKAQPGAGVISITGKKPNPLETEEPAAASPEEESIDTSKGRAEPKIKTREQAIKDRMDGIIAAVKAKGRVYVSPQISVEYGEGKTALAKTGPHLKWAGLIPDKELNYWRSQAEEPAAKEPKAEEPEEKPEARIHKSIEEIANEDKRRKIGNIFFDTIPQIAWGDAKVLQTEVIEEYEKELAEETEEGNRAQMRGAIAFAKARVKVLLARGPKKVDEIQESGIEDLDKIIDEEEGREKTVKPPVTTGRGQTEKTEKPDGEPKKRPPKGLQDILGSAAKHGVKGADAALTGLFELFGGRGLRSGLGAIDEDTYKKAKPHFEEAWKQFKEAGKEFREFVRWIMDQFGGAGPYLKRWVREVKGVKEEEPTTEKPETEEEPAAGAPEEEEGEIKTNEPTVGKGKKPKKERRKKEGYTGKLEDVGEEMAGARKSRDHRERSKAIEDEINKGTGEHTPEGLVKALLNMTERAKLFPISPLEGRSPGAERFLENIKRKFVGFVEYAGHKAGGSRRKYGTPLKGALLRIAAGSGWYGYDLNLLKQDAAKYVSVLEQNYEVTKNLTSMSDIRDALFKLWAKDQETAQAWKDKIDEYSVDGLTGSWYPAADDFSDVGNDTAAFFNERSVSRGRSEMTRLFSDYHFDLRKETEETKNKPIERTIRKLETIKTPKKYRKGKDVIGDDLINAFGVRGVEFGNWTDATHTHLSANLTFDSFHMLAETLKIPLKGISIKNGERDRLGLAFGARGRGTAAAHYEPENHVINLTKTRGDGSLAHEWGHALDFMGNWSMAENQNEDYRQMNARNDLYETLKRTYQTANLDKTVELILRGLWRQARNIQGDTALEKAKTFLKERWETELITETHFFHNAKQLDGGKIGKYYSKPEELFARAFDAYIADKMQGDNFYLTDKEFVAPGAVEKRFNRQYGAYPTAKERDRFNQVFDDFFGGIAWSKAGEPKMKADYVPVSLQERARVKAAIDKILEKLEDIYAAIHQGSPSEDGLYWYAYKGGERASFMQPKGYRAYDDTWTATDEDKKISDDYSVSIEGTGAVAYDQSPSIGDIVKFNLHPITHQKTDSTVYLAEEVEDEIQAGSPKGLDEFEAEDGEEPGGARRPQTGSGATGRSGGPEDQGTGQQAGAELGRSGEPGEVGTNLPPKRDGDAGTTAEPLALDVNYTITSTDIALGRTPHQRFSDNVEAIQLVKKIESEGRMATPAEQKALVRFSGWGGFSEALHWGEIKEAWKAKANILKEILTPEELDAARESALTSFYSPPEEVANIWYALERMGFEGGRVLDPSCGIGHFFGLMPEGMRERSSLLGVDMDHISALIAKHLYQGSTIHTAKFEDLTLPENYFDLVTTNVPFLETRPHDRKHNALNLTLHDYFINKSLDLVRPGGIVSVITSTGTMDKADTIGRQAFSQKAELVGALRMPNGRYDAAQAASDILFFRKKSKAQLPEIQKHSFLASKPVRVPQMNSARTEATQKMVGIGVNEYFQENQEQTLGQLAAYTRYGEYSFDCYVAADTENFDERLREAIEKLPINVIIRDAGPKELNLLDMVSTPDAIKNQNFYVNESDGKIYLNHDGKPEPFEEMRGYPNAQGVIRRFIKLRGMVREILRGSLEGKPESELKVLRDKLKAQYKAFVKQYGPLNSPKNQAVILQDIDAGSVLGLEKWDDENEEVTGLAAIFDRNTLPDYRPPNSVETPRDALIASLIWKGKINIPYMQSLWKGEREAMLTSLKGVIYDDPEKGWVTADEYLAGDVRHKLRVAQAAMAANPEYETNVKALEAIQPKMLTIDEITVRLGSAWIPTDTIEEFLNETFRTHDSFRVQFIPEIGTYVSTVTGDSQAAADRRKQHLMQTLEATATYGTQKVNFFTSQSKGILDFALGGGAPRVTETRLGPDKKEYTVFLEKETDAAAAALDRLHQAFARWAAKNKEHRERLEKIYNDRVNVYVGKRPDGSHLTFPGKVPDDIIKLRVHQKNAVWRFLTDGIAYFAHDVGTGKTFTQVAAIMEAKRLGLARKPMWAVKRETFEQIKSDFHKLYPAANVLFLNVPHVAEKRRKVLNSVALNDFDCVVVTHESFTTIPVSKDTQARFIQEEIDQLKLALEMQRRATTDIGRRGKKREGAAARELSKRLKKREEALKKVLDVKKDEVFTFEEMGVDMLVVDEMHQFKNVNIVTEHQNVKGISIQGSGRAEDLMMKVRHLHNVVGRNIIFASGTPITNSVVEIYNLMKYMMPDYMKRMGVYHFDRWLSSFAEIGQEAEYSPSGGGFQISTKVKNIINRPELARTLRQYMDVVKALDIPELKRPKLKGEEPINIKVEPVPFQKTMAEVLIARTAHIKAVGQGNAFFHRVPDLMLRIVNDGRSLSADPRVFDPRLPDMEGTKVHKLVSLVLDHYKKTYDAIDPDTGKEYQEGKGTQLIFCDRGVPGSEKKGRFNLYGDIKQKLIEGGIPENEIAIIHETDEAGGGIKGKDKAKLRLYKKINAGRVRVLIANTSKASTGVNVQERVAAIHHYDADWNYANWEQRTGRGWRHGNRLKEVTVYNYGIAKSLDAFMWSKISDKARVLNDVVVDSDGMRTMNADVSYNAHSVSASEALAAFADDPLHREKVELEAKARRLENQLSVFNNTRADKRRELIAIPGQIEGNQNTIQRNQKYKPIAEQITAIQIGEEFFDLDKQGGDANRAAGKLVTGEVKKLLAEKSLGEKLIGEFGFLTEKTETYPVEEKYDEEVKEETKGAKKKGDKWVISSVRTVQKERKVKIFNPILGARLTVEQPFWVKEPSPDYHVRIGKAINHAGSMESISRVVTGLKTGIDRNISEATENIERLKAASVDIEAFLEKEFAEQDALQAATKRLREVVQALLEKEGEGGSALRRMNESERFALIDDKMRAAYEGVTLKPGIGPILRAQLARQESLRKREGHDPALDQEIARALAESRVDRTRVEIGDEEEEFKGLADPSEVPDAGETPGEKPEQYAIVPADTSTPEFEEWFGKSKLVDKAGEPLVMYHATTAGFDRFKRSDIGVHVGTLRQAQARIGISEEVLKEAEERGDVAEYQAGRSVVPVYVAIQNPLRMEDADAWADFKRVYESVPEEIFEEIDKTVRDELWDIYSELENRSDIPKRLHKKGLDLLRTALESLGYDGIVYRNQFEGRSKPEDSYIAFHPEQIKSIYNRGTWAPGDPRISYSVAARERARGRKQITPSVSIDDVRKIFKGQPVVLTPEGELKVFPRQGRSVTIKSVEQITPNRVALNIAYGVEKIKGEIAGKYRDGVIELQRDVSDKWTLTHESYHFMEDAGIITHSDVGILRAKIRSLEKKGKWTPANPNDIGGAEDRAAWVTEQLEGVYDVKTLTGQILQKIRQFLDRVLEAFGIRTAGAVARDIETGRVFGEKAEGGRRKAEGVDGDLFTFAPGGTVQRPTFYSQLARVLGAKLPNAGTPESFRSTISTWAKKGEFKADELKWSGLEEWLTEQGKKWHWNTKTGEQVDDRITKQQVLDFLKANEIEIREVTKGEKPPEAVEPDIYGDYTVPVGESQPKFAQWQLPGGENYRELLLTLPVKRTGKAGWVASSRGGLSREYFETEQQARGYADSRPASELWSVYPQSEVEADKYRGDVFHSSHWSEPNVLAHVRMNDRTGLNGEKILFLEEVQSDWHQEGRKKGYKTGKEWEVYDQDTGRVISQHDSMLEADSAAAELRQGGTPRADSRMAPQSVPPAPFAKTWHEFVLKRMLRYAAENGYDRLAFTTGEQQNERYDLSKQLDKNGVQWTKYKDGWSVYAKSKDGTPILAGGTLDEKELEDYLGKDIAKQIVDSTQSYGQIRGDDLRVGGKGMKGFYDKIIPEFLNKYAKKWGAKTGESVIRVKPEVRLEVLTPENEMPSVDEAAGILNKIRESRNSRVSEQSTATHVVKALNDGMSLKEALETQGNIEIAQRLGVKMEWSRKEIPVTVHSLPITSSMRESVLTQGQPMFAIARGAGKASAVFLGYQETGQGGKIPLFNIEGGERDGSTVSADTLKELGIEVPEINEEQEWYAIAKQPPGVLVAQDIEKDRSFVNKIFELRDVAKLRIQNQVAELQRQVQKMAGKPSRRKFTLGFAHNKELKRSMASDELDRAMMIYRDLQTKPEKADEFRTWAEAKLKDKDTSAKDRLTIKGQLKLLDQALNLSQEQKDFAMDTLGELFENAYQLAKRTKIIQTHRDNYVRRLWNLPEGKEEYRGTGSGYGFSVYTTAAKKRTLPTILDGWMGGYDLRVKGLTNSYEKYITELATIIANKAFIQRGTATHDTNGNAMFTTTHRAGYKPLKANGFQVWRWAGEAEVELSLPDEEALAINTYGRKFFATPPERIPETWAVYSSPTSKRALRVFDNEDDAKEFARNTKLTRIEHRRAADVSTMFEKQPLYAPAPIADMINKMTATETLFNSVPGLKFLLRLNAGLKSWILMSSFFHHMAGSRSWVFAVHHGWKGVNPVKAYKAGLQKIEDLHPLVELGVKNGLTLGDIQDWSEMELRENKGYTERLVNYLGLEKAAKVIEYGKFKRERWADSLFKKYFAGLKAEAFVIEYTHELQKATEKYTAGTITEPPNPDRIAERVGRLINDDFGGLHLQRMGRNPTLQKVARMLLLAPDWTESNFRTVTGMIPGLNEKISKIITDIPPPRGMDELYRKFWARAMLRIGVMTVIAQMLLNGSDESEEWLKEQALSNQFTRYRWTEVEITRLYELLGIDTDERKKTFSIGGHFFDPLKLIDPWTLAKHKGSPLTRLGESLFSGSDWAARPYTGTAEFLQTGKTVKKSFHQRKEGAYDRLPATVVNQVVGMQPIQVGQFIRFLQGEEDGLSALMHSIGAATHNAYPPFVETPIISTGKAGSDVVQDRLKELKSAGVLHMAPPSRTVTMRGITEKMSREQYQRYIEESSALAEPKLAKLMSSERWGTLSPERQAEYTEKIIKNARRKARGKAKRVMAREKKSIAQEG